MQPPLHQLLWCQWCFFSRAGGRPRGRAQYLVLEVPLLFYSVFSKNTQMLHRMRLERKQGLELACSLTFWRVRGKGRIFNGFMQPFGLLSHPVAPQAEAADIQRLRSRPALSRQEQCLCSQIQRLLFFFQGLLTVRWKGSWRYFEGLPASWESRSWQLHLCKSILRATIAQKSPVSGDWGPTKLLESHPPSQGLQVLDSAGAAGSGLFRYTTHNPKSREDSRMCKDMQTVSCLAYIIQSVRM